jgi:hypothetical protein
MIDRQSKIGDYGRMFALKYRHQTVATRTRLSIGQYDALPEMEGVKYELNERELITVAASPRLVHNRVRDEVGFSMREFVRNHGLGEVTVETDFRLSEGMVPIVRISRSSGRSGLQGLIPETGSKPLQTWLWKRSRPPTILTTLF